MIQKLSIFEPTYQEQKFQEKLDAFIVACKEIEHLSYNIHANLIKWRKSAQNQDFREKMLSPKG